jgi:hypothetical protein
MNTRDTLCIRANAMATAAKSTYLFGTVSTKAGPIAVAVVLEAITSTMEACKFADKLRRAMVSGGLLGESDPLATYTTSGGKKWLFYPTVHYDGANGDYNYGPDLDDVFDEVLAMGAAAKLVDIDEATGCASLSEAPGVLVSRLKAHSHRLLHCPCYMYKRRKRTDADVSRVVSGDEAEAAIASLTRKGKQAMKGMLTRVDGLVAEANVVTETKAAAFTVLSGNAPTDAERTSISQKSYAALLAKIEQLSTLETPNQ